MTMYLYRKLMLAVTLATALVLLSLSSQAQFRTPQPERKTPRAIGVLETFKNGSRRLVPVTFFYEKHYYDATFYHATPVPFTLYSETVYEVQQFGKPLGTFTVQSATQSSAAWFGNGRFKGLPDPSLLAKKSAPAPVVLEDPSKPVLHRREGSEGDNPGAHPVTTTNTAPADEDPDRPKLHRREGSPGTSDAPPTAQPGTPSKGSSSPQTSTQDQTQPKPPADQPQESSGQDPNRPKLHRKDDSSGGKSAPGTNANAPATPPAGAPQPGTPASGTPPTAVQPLALTAKDELSDDPEPDHPVLRRGKPIQAQSGRDLPDFKREEPVSRHLAVSDAGTSDPQPLLYLCHEEERKQLESWARDLAQAELRRFGAQRGLTMIQATAPSKAVSGRKSAAAKPPALPDLKLTDEQFVPYDLDYSNNATVVFSARHTPEPAANPGAMKPGAKKQSWVVTVIARHDEGKLIKLYSSVSDPRELDLYPELRLVDAVDPDGYGHYALLFRVQKREGVSWLLGRLTGYELQTVFETPAR